MRKLKPPDMFDADPRFRTGKARTRLGNPSADAGLYEDGLWSHPDLEHLLRKRLSRDSNPPTGSKGSTREKPPVVEHDAGLYDEEPWTYTQMERYVRDTTSRG